VQINPSQYQSFSDEKSAVNQAIRRSQDIGNLRGDELNRAVMFRYME